jgi:hypothetical protein
VRSSALKTDSITELTTDNGVTIESLNIEDGVINNTLTDDIIAQGLTKQIIRIEGGASGNMVLGEEALQSQTGSTLYCVAIGYRALQDNDSGAHNIAIGRLSLSNNVSGDSNIGIGTSALSNSSGTYNIGIGQNAGNIVTSGNYNVFLGYGSNIPSVGASNNRIGIGYNAKPSANWYCQIGENGLSSNSSKLRFYSQDVCQEAWRDTNTRLAYIDGTGNIQKDSIDSFNGTVTDTFSGPWSDSPASYTLTYVVFRNMITVHFPDMIRSSNSASTQIQMSGTLPTNIRPSEQVQLQIYTRNADTKYADGYLNVDTDGTIHIWRSYPSTTFNAGSVGTSGAYTFTVSYKL